jgi:hypothetical protein
MNEKLIDAKDTSKVLGISRPTLSRIKHEIGFYRISSKIMFSETKIDDYLRRVENRSKSKCDSVRS